MKKSLLLFGIYYLVNFHLLQAQNSLTPYKIFDRNGKEVSFEEMTKALLDYQVIFFGEQHNNPIAHWMQLELTQALYTQTDSNLVLGAEMFEADAQMVLDEYLSGKIKESHLIKEGKTWDNYPTDYAPLVNFAKANQLAFYATNVPRRYASLVARKGQSSLEGLDKYARKNLLPPLPLKVPYDAPSYTAMKAMMGGHGHGGHGDNNNFIDAQALKDASMGFRIATAIKDKKNKGKTFLHFNGNFHSKNHEGTVYYLNQYHKKVTTVVISFVEQNEINSIETQNQGNNEFTIVCVSNMTKTY